MNYDALIQSITTLQAESAGRAASAVNQALVLRNWVIGAHIVEFEQNGEDRAEYGDGLLRRLSSDLGACGIKGTSPDMLERMRLFSRHYPQLGGSISAPLVRIFTRFATNSVNLISAPVVRKSVTDVPTPLSPELVLRFTWTHLADLVRIEDPWKRAFYEIECLNGNWSNTYPCVPICQNVFPQRIRCGLIEANLDLQSALHHQKLSAANSLRPH